MKKYANKNGDSGVSSYQIGIGYILVQFITGSIYEYTSSSAGTNNIEIMNSLAESGSGLNTFINSHVKYKYSRKIR